MNDADLIKAEADGFHILKLAAAKKRDYATAVEMQDAQVAALKRLKVASCLTCNGTGIIPEFTPVDGKVSSSPMFCPHCSQ